MEQDVVAHPPLRNQLVLPIIYSLLLLFGSLLINFYAGSYATESVSNSVTDIILSNIPVFDVDWFFVYGAIAFWAFIIFISVTKPHRVPFVAKTISLFVVIRAVFVSLTHIAPFPNEIAIQTSALLSKFTFGGDLFFSGHTGLPFLMALIFWNNKRLRLLFVATSIFFAFVVLLGHLHYSIDVLGAFFITYSIYHMAEIFFKKDKIMFEAKRPLP